MRAPYITEQIALTQEIAAILIADGLKAEPYDIGANIPDIGIIVPDPQEPRALWEFILNASDRNIWIYQIGTAVGDEYEALVFDDLGVDMDIETPAPLVAAAILRAIGAGIDPEDAARIIAAHTAMQDVTDD